MSPLPDADREPLVVYLGDVGLKYESVDSVVSQAREDRGRRVVVLAPNAKAAKRFRQEHGLLDRQVVYATEGAVRGWTDVDVVVLPGWRDQSDAERIWHTLLPAWACRPRGRST